MPARTISAALRPLGRHAIREAKGDIHDFRIAKIMNVPFCESLL
jgi:hypothetical protein